MGIPVVAGVGAVAGFVKGQEAKRRERNIADRVSKYQGFDDAKLRAIITTYGGEMGEAAQQVLNQRGQSTFQPNSSGGLADSVTREGSSVMLLALVGMVALLVLKR